MNGESWEGDFAVMRSDERIVEVHAVNSPVFDESGAVTGVISLAFDVTADRASQEQLRQMLAIAQILRDVGQTLVAELDADRVDADRHRCGPPAGGRDHRRRSCADRRADDVVVAATSGRTAEPANGRTVPAGAIALQPRVREHKPTCIDDVADRSTVAYAARRGRHGRERSCCAAASSRRCGRARAS